MSSLARSMRLPDGRDLGFDEIGDPAGFPCLFFHGVPGSRTYWSLAVDESRPLLPGVRLVSPDRPGMGLSSECPQRTVASFAADIAHLADELRIERFAIVGFSGGSAYALATATALPERVEAVALVAPIADLGVARLKASIDPAARHALSLIAVSPSLQRNLLTRLIDARRVLTRAAHSAWSQLPSADRRTLASPAVNAAAAQTMSEAAREGLEGPRTDLALLSQPWDFQLSDVRAPVIVFSGGADPWSTDEMAHWFEVELPRCSVRRYASDGHFTVLVDRFSDVLESLASAVTAEHADDTLPALG